MNEVTLSGLISVTLAMLVYLVGVRLTRKVRLLREYNIPQPVSGGLLAAFIVLLLYKVFDLQVEFTLLARDYFLVLFFSTIGMNARISDLSKGGKPLVIFLILTSLFVVIQNVVGTLGALAFGFPREIGVVMGSAALIGGHGTVLAWTPMLQENTDFAGIAELGIAAATLGLVLAAMVGGPIGKFLIERRNLEPADPESPEIVGLSFDEEVEIDIDHVHLVRTLFFVHIAMAIGVALHSALDGTGLSLPLFVPCMLTAIIVGNLHSRFTESSERVQRTPTLALTSDFALGLFLAMSLMSLQLWTLAGLGAALLIVLLAQTAVAVAFAVFVVFRVMGSNYFSAVLAAGFGGFSLGATPTAIANMTAVTKHYGPSPMAFIVLPLVAAFFVDLVNVVVIRAFLPF